MHARTISVVFVDIKSVAATNYGLHTLRIFTHKIPEESDIGGDLCNPWTHLDLA